MANTVTLKSSTPCRLVYEIAGDGTATGTIASATLITDAVTGPLEDALSASYADQAAMRAAMLYGAPVQIHTQIQTSVADTTAQVNQPAADVDVDAITATRPEINYQMHDTTGQVVLLIVEYVHTLVR
jgi:hypothetical protein